VNAYIYIEGGGDSSGLHRRCREGFSKLIEKMGFRGRMPKLIACGSRDNTFDDFKTALAEKNADDYVAMWIDSEEPMENIDIPWEHLRNVTTVHQWARPEGADDEQVLLMTTCMETWIVADRETLKQHYGRNLQESALPSLQELEQRPRNDIQEKLNHATRNCSNAYEKGKRSFDILGRLTPDVLLQHLPSFNRVVRILREKLYNTKPGALW